MASPIKITPTLSGKQSENFNKKLEATSTMRVSSIERTRISALVAKVLSNKKTK